VLQTGQLRRLMLVFMAAAVAVALIITVAPKATHASTRLTQAERVVMIARSHLGAHFRLGTEGMRYFDCSGLVYRVYQQANLLKKVGGSRKLAAGYYHWFKQRGLLGRSNPKPGDLIWYTKKGHIEHIGLYIGHGKAISALINPWGVMKHSVNGVRTRFLTYGHVRLER
jgi:cell wall-associated NlpC family hydrolase